ncbi:MAG: hypothetical protein Q7R92_02970 [bacterium]|nr:hypothetical protein [bacterium]
MELTTCEATGLTITDEPDNRKAPAMVTDANGIPQTPETALSFIKQGKLLLALEYAKRLMDPATKIILSMAIIKAAAETGSLKIGMEAAELTGMKLTDRELSIIFRASLKMDNWKTCLDCLEIIGSLECKKIAFDLIVAKGAEAGERYRRDFRYEADLKKLPAFKKIKIKIIDFINKFSWR